MNTFRRNATARGASLLVAVAVLSAACTVGTTSPSAPPAQSFVPAVSPSPDPPGGNGGPIDAAGEWRLDHGTNAGAAVPIVPGADITFIVDGSTISGRSACNSYGGQVVVKDGQVRFGDMMMTEMACEEPVMASESAYHAALGKVNAATRQGDTLTLLGPEVELVFVRVPPPPAAELIDTPWILDSIISGDAVSSVVGDPAELRLSADGSMTGTTGCRAFGARYAITGDVVTVTDLVVDSIACPPTTSAQDATVIAVLEGGFRATVKGQALTISGRDGEGLGYTGRAPEIPPAP